MQETSKEVDNKTYTEDPDTYELAQKVIKEKHLNIEPAKIKYLLVFPNINRTTIGRCTVVRNKWKYFADTDYVIELSGDIWDSISNKVKEIILEHELLHVYPVHNEKKDTWSFNILDHDIQDFYKIIKNYGIDWFNEIKTTMASVYNLEAEEIDNIKL